MVNVHMAQLASMEDKVERAEATYTLSYASDFHRCFGHLLKVEKPNLDVDGVLRFCEEQASVNFEVGEIPYKWGWSNEFLDMSYNGGVLPSCWICRRNGLAKMGFSTGDEILNTVLQAVSSHAMHECANWTIDENSRSKLQFSPPPDYPQHTPADCPVEIPRDRCPGAEKLNHVKLTFSFLKTAA